MPTLRSSTFPTLPDDAPTQVRESFETLCANVKEHEARFEAVYTSLQLFWDASYEHYPTGVPSVSRVSRQLLSAHRHTFETANAPPTFGQKSTLILKRLKKPIQGSDWRITEVLLDCTFGPGVWVGRTFLAALDQIRKTLTPWDAARTEILRQFQNRSTENSRGVDKNCVSTLDVSAAYEKLRFEDPESDLMLQSDGDKLSQTEKRGNEAQDGMPANSKRRRVSQHGGSEQLGDETGETSVERPRALLQRSSPPEMENTTLGIEISGLPESESSGDEDKDDHGMLDGFVAALYTPPQEGVATPTIPDSEDEDRMSDDHDYHAALHTPSKAASFTTPRAPGSNPSAGVELMIPDLSNLDSRLSPRSTTLSLRPELISISNHLSTASMSESGISTVATPANIQERLQVDVRNAPSPSVGIPPMALPTPSRVSSPTVRNERNTRDSFQQEQLQQNFGCSKELLDLKSWLTSSTIYALLHRLLPRAGGLTLYDTGSFSSTGARFEDRKIAARLLAPLNIGNLHWVLIDLDLTNGRCDILDPLTGLISVDELHALIATRIDRITAKTIDIRFRPVPQQQDGWNCGVFVVVWALQLATGRESRDLNPRVWRILLGMLLRDSSEWDEMLSAWMCETTNTSVVTASTDSEGTIEAAIAMGSSLKLERDRTSQLYDEVMEELQASDAFIQDIVRTAEHWHNEEKSSQAVSDRICELLKEASTLSSATDPKLHELTLTADRRANTVQATRKRNLAEAGECVRSTHILQSLTPKLAQAVEHRFRGSQEKWTSARGALMRFFEENPA